MAFWSKYSSKLNRQKGLSKHVSERILLPRTVRTDTEKSNGETENMSIDSVPRICLAFNSDSK